MFKSTCTAFTVILVWLVLTGVLTAGILQTRLEKRDYAWQTAEPAGGRP